jgi:hypothetical protein
MPSQSGSEVNLDISKLLELLNASEQQGDLAAEGVVAEADEGTLGLEDPHAIAAGPAEQARKPDQSNPAADEQHSVKDRPISRPTLLRETTRPAVENAENRFAAHIVHGMWKIMKD